MLTFEYTTVINAPIKTVWEFYQREDNLNLLLPPWQPVKVIKQPQNLNEGNENEYLLTFGLIPVSWKNRYTAEYQKYRFFTEEQIEGFLESWRHQHLFEESENKKTILIDRINYQIPGGELSEFLLRQWVNSRLTDMFAYRHKVTQKYCQSSFSTFEL